MRMVEVPIMEEIDFLDVEYSSLSKRRGTGDFSDLLWYHFPPQKET